MNLELHATGASFVAGKRDNNPRDLVIEIMTQMPNATRVDQFEKFRALLHDNLDEFQRAVDFYFFVNMHDYLTGSRQSRSSPVNSRSIPSVETIKEKIIMLDLAMPNGKSMKDCTGAEMAKFGNRYQRIAEKVGKAKMVGAVLDEDQVKAILK